MGDGVKKKGPSRWYTNTLRWLLAVLISQVMFIVIWGLTYSSRLDHRMHQAEKSCTISAGGRVWRSAGEVEYRSGGGKYSTGSWTVGFYDSATGHYLRVSEPFVVEGEARP